ncbi:hypothetical protein [Nocardia blacklockiae]|uniref:hypothetical protein n=1 Tax=Nocardia blacklockiae TaxID=480036 RepID=UPI001895D63B|nr:hypothetical protein [Nocardia blacklockiae]MBF6175797.1 hypothetical protein [Nocardia blacklockiae]
MNRKQVAVILERLDIRGQVPPSDPRISVPGDLLKPMRRNTSVREPGETGLPEVMPTQMLVTQLRDDLMPVRYLPQKAGCMRPPRGANRRASGRRFAARIRSSTKDRMSSDNRNLVSAFAFHNGRPAFGHRVNPANMSAERSGSIPFLDRPS